MYSRRLVVGYIFLIGFSIALVFISGFNSLPSFLGALLLYSIILYIFHVVWAFIRKNEILGFFHFFIIFLYKVSLIISIFIIGLGLFSYYQNEVHPAHLPSYVLSNGDKKVHFQTMSHIASPSFYENIKRDILEKKKQGYVLYYEGVLPGSEENMNAFNSALGIKLDVDTYHSLSHLYGIVSQNNSDFLGIHDNNDYNVDLSIDEIMDIYSVRSKKKENSSVLLKENDIYDIQERSIKQLKDISPHELSIIRYLNQSLLNFILKHEALRNTISRFISVDIFSIILKDRDKNLVMNILESKDTNIFVIYGLMHFEGVWKLLREHDQRWKIIENREYQVITQHS